MDKVVFFIQKSFGKVCLYKDKEGLLLEFIPIVDGEEKDSSDPNYCLIKIEKAYLGEFLVVCRCFLSGFETPDFTYAKNLSSEEEIIVRLYRDKQKNVDECWLRLVTGKTEDKRKRIKLTKRDLVCLQTALETILFD
ncbi:MAG: hypothetical protein NZT61_05685 [Deltaproteobacteria bacterium]|nr:hypothetical protein [Deltaproteobacteria bacterium]MCX7952192.1 hypothetical protein [Deltaproteobacteria bacterium]